MKKILFLFLILLSGCTSDTDSNLPYINYKKAVQNEMVKTKVFQGFIDRDFDVELSFSISGIIEKIYVTEGDEVKKGELLAKLDNREYKLEIEKKEYELKDANVNYNRAKSYYERISKLYKAGGISYNDWENAQTDLKVNSNKINIIKDALEIAREKEKFTNIYAPSDGYIIKTYAEDRQYTQSGSKVFYFQGKGGLEARIFVSQNDINSIKTGQRVILKADSIKGVNFIGKVKSKVNSSENGNYRVTVLIEPDIPELLDGMSVKAYFSEETLNGIFVKKSAIIADTLGEYIFVLQKTGKNKGKVLKRKVETGDTIEELTLIKNGLELDELYVTDGVNKIMDGVSVEFGD